MLLVIGREDARPVMTVVRRSGRRKCSGLGVCGHERLWTRGADRITNYAGYCVLQLDSIMFQSRPRCPV